VNERQINSSSISYMQHILPHYRRRQRACNKLKKAGCDELVDEENIPTLTSVLNPELYGAVKFARSQSRTYIFNRLLQNHGNIAIWLPLHQHSLSSFEIMWSVEKVYTAEYNITLN
jgi:hypothetical protein